jgi:hypothetical protein
MEVGITGHNFGRGPSKDHSTKVWLQLPTNMAAVSKNRTYGKIAGFG